MSRKADIEMAWEVYKAGGENDTALGAMVAAVYNLGRASGLAHTMDWWKALDESKKLRARVRKMLEGSK